MPMLKMRSTRETAAWKRACFPRPSHEERLMKRIDEIRWGGAVDLPRFGYICVCVKLFAGEGLDGTLDVVRLLGVPMMTHRVGQSIRVSK